MVFPHVAAVPAVVVGDDGDDDAIDIVVVELMISAEDWVLTVASVIEGLNSFSVIVVLMVVFAIAVLMIFVVVEVLMVSSGDYESMMKMVSVMWVWMTSSVARVSMVF